MKTDVAIVGAGPSGCAAASILAENGLKVALIDRAQFPRDKVCGDVASPLALTCLRRLGLGPWIDAGNHQRPRRLVLCFPAGQRVQVEQSPELPSMGMVIPRRELDRALLEHTLAKGITFLDETVALGATVDRQGVTIECEKGDRRSSVQAQVILAGDGSTAPFSRGLGLVRDEPDIAAVRTYVRGDRPDVDAYHVFFLQHLLPSYGWIFPVAPGLFNVGVGVPVSKLRKGGTKLKSILSDFLSSHYADQVVGACRPVEPARAHAIRMPGLCPNQLAAERVLTMGDAASLANPLSGEGIGPALDSGMIAAEHVCRAFQEGDFSRERLSCYSLAIQRRYGADYRAASILRAWMARPLLANGAANLGRSEPEFAQMLARAVLSQSARELFRPGTLLKGIVYWPARAILRGFLQKLGKSERAA